MCLHATDIICQQSSSTLLLIDMFLCTHPPPRQVVQSLKSLTSVLSHCLSKWRRFGTSAQSSHPQLQLVCWTTLHLAICLGKLLEAQGPHLTDVMLLQCMSATLVSLNCTLLMLPTMLCSLKSWWQTVLLISLPPQTPPTATASVLRDLMMNGVMAVTCPPLHEMLQPYFDKLDTPDSQVRYLGKHIRVKLIWNAFVFLHLYI